MEESSGKGARGVAAVTARRSFEPARRWTRWNVLLNSPQDALPFIFNPFWQRMPIASALGEPRVVRP